MSENALETLVDELYKNGIAVEGHELTGRASGEPKKVLRTVFELNFSEHDKVFEDKIAKLEKKNKDLESCFTQREQDSTDMIMELKQRITELESKETEKPTKYITVIVAKEINGQTYVTLDDFMSVVNDLQSEIGT